MTNISMLLIEYQRAVEEEAEKELVVKEIKQRQEEELKPLQLSLKTVQETKEILRQQIKEYVNLNGAIDIPELGKAVIQVRTGWKVEDPLAYLNWCQANNQMRLLDISKAIKKAELNKVADAFDTAQLPLPGGVAKEENPTLVVSLAKFT